MGLLSIAVVVALMVASVSVGLSAWAVIRAYIPPQSRAVRELRAEVETLQDDTERVHARLTERASRANMDKARNARVDKREREDELITRALELTQKPGSPELPAGNGGGDIESQRAAYRRQLAKGD